MAHDGDDGRHTVTIDDIPRYPSSARCDSDVLSHNDRNNNLKQHHDYQNYSRNFSSETQNRNHHPLSLNQKSPTYSNAPSSSATRSTERTATANPAQRVSNSNTASTAATAARKLKRLSFGMRSNTKTITASTDGGPKQSLDYTFFRDPTPPPSDYETEDRVGTQSTRAEKPFAAGAAVGAGGEYDGGEYDYRWDHVAPPAPLPGKERKGSICGMGRKWCLILAIILIVVIVAVGVGVGVGVGLKSSSNSGNADEAKETTTATSTSSTINEPATTTTSPPRVTVTSRATCPAANNTEFLVPHSDKSFLRICGRDYSGQFGGPSKAIDLGEVLTSSMEDCMIQCAGYPGCEGCGWGVIQGDEGEKHRCWLKAKLMDSHVARPGWDFAILQ